MCVTESIQYCRGPLEDLKTIFKLGEMTFDGMSPEGLE